MEKHLSITHEASRGRFPTSDHADRDMFEGVLAEERQWNATWLNALRPCAVMLFLVPQVVLAGVTRGTWVLAIYGLVAVALFLVARKSDRVARWSALGVPFIDMPGVFLKQWLDMETPGINPRALAVFTMGVMIILVMLSAFMLNTRRLILAGVVALGLQQVLQWQARDTPIGRIGSAAAILVTVVLCGAAMARRIVMVRRFSVERLRLERFRRYFSPQVAQTIQRAEDEIATGRLCEITVLFSDLRGFTAAAESATPAAVLELLNAMHSSMVQVVFEHEGTLDKYTGDGLMAYFGAPVLQSDHATRALRCALAMQLVFSRLHLGFPGKPSLRLSIGLHTGPAVIGVVGAQNRREFTAVGDTVNLASRMENLTRTYDHDVLLSGETARRIEPPFGAKMIATAQVRGRAEPVEVYVPSSG